MCRLNLNKVVVYVNNEEAGALGSLLLFLYTVNLKFLTIYLYLLLKSSNKIKTL